MQTLKDNIIILDVGDRVQVRYGDLTISMCAHPDPKSNRIMISRPLTDGRWLRANLQALDDLPLQERQTSEKRVVIDRLATIEIGPNN